MSNFEKLVINTNKCNPFVYAITGDFNARSSSWWSKDINTIKGSKLFSLTSSNGFPQLTNERKHIQTSSSSSIDLIPTNQPNLSVNSSVHESLHRNCHHQIIHSSFNLNISYPPPYQQLTWDHKKAASVNWERLFDQTGINAEVVAFNENILNIFRNYVPNKYITIYDKDRVWMNETIKSKIKAKNALYKYIFRMEDLKVTLFISKI